MSDVLSYPFMQRALVAAVLVGVVCSVIGTYVVLRKMAFIGAGISHSAFGGVALGYLLGLDPIGIAIPFCFATAMAIGWVSRKGRVSEDTAIGIAFASTMALGALFISLKKGYNLDLFGYLFGSILAVSKSDLWLILGLGLGVIVIVALLFKELLFVSFDEEMAAVSGLPVQTLYFLLLGLMALTVVISIKIVGIILVEALLVIPAAAAFQHHAATGGSHEAGSGTRGAQQGETASGHPGLPGLEDSGKPRTGAHRRFSGAGPGLVGRGRPPGGDCLPFSGRSADKGEDGGLGPRRGDGATDPQTPGSHPGRSRPESPGPQRQAAHCRKDPYCGAAGERSC